MLKLESNRSGLEKKYFVEKAKIFTRNGFKIKTANLAYEINYGEIMNILR